MIAECSRGLTVRNVHFWAKFPAPFRANVAKGHLMLTACVAFQLGSAYHQPRTVRTKGRPWVIVQCLDD
jgi:hypothetical protein